MNRDSLLLYVHCTKNQFYISAEENASITLLTHFEEDKIQILQNRNFSMVIIDDFDKVAKKATLRKLRGHFKVGLTHRNFVVSNVLL